MNDYRNRLIKCFSLVFQNVDPDQIPTLSVSSHAEWDSLNTMNLVALIEEEFDFQVADDGTAEFLSFELVLEYVEGFIDVSDT